MKAKLILFGLIILSVSVSAQKQATVGSKSFLIRGEKVISFEELGLYAKETDWLEVYLHITKDSIIVTELQSKNSESATADYIFISSSKKSDLDFDNVLAVKHDLIKAPTTLLKVEVKTKGEAESVKMEAWGVSGSLGMIPASGFRVIVQDDEQAMEIMKRIKAK